MIMSLLNKKIEDSLNLNKIIFFGVFFVVFFMSNINLTQAGNQLNNQSFELKNSEINNWNIINLVNLERGLQGLDYLEEDEILNQVARKKLQDMINNDYFAHTSPLGIDPWEWFSVVGYDFEYAGENLATDFKTINGQHKAWMKSPAHKKNILDKRFTSTGIAVQEKVLNGEKVSITVQVFATPKQVMMISPNFTPQTYQVPKKLFNQNLENEGIGLTLNKKNLGEVAGISKSQSFSDFLEMEGVEIKLFSWLIVLLITIIIAMMEYQIFIRKYYCEIGEVV